MPFPPNERSLFVIEQQGKKSHLSFLLSKAGFTDFEVQPTYGALFDLPADVIAISPISLLVTGYEVKRKPVAHRLQALAAGAARIFVMTDADREGELIAAQVRQLCPGKPLIRLRLRTLTLDALREAMQDAGKIDVGAATASAARRIVDRIIGYGFSTPSIPRRVGIVGRVLTAALSAFDRNPVACGEWSGKLGGFDARGTVTNRSLEDAKRLEVFLQHSGHELERLPHERVRRLIAPPRPCNCADAILEGRRRLGIPTRTGERLLQARYQEGGLSYIRSDSTHIGPEARSLALQMARASRLTIASDIDEIYQRPTARIGRKHAHEALHPTAAIDLELDPAVQEKSDGMIALVGRRLAMSMAAPIEVEREQIVPAALRQLLSERLGESAARLDFQLTLDLSPATAWMRWLKRTDKASLPKVELYGADATALSFLAGSNFGRPSNQIRFVDSLIDHGFIDEYGNVTPLGQQALDYAREHAPFLLDPSRIERVEQLLDQNESSSVPQLVSQLCDVMGIPVELAQSAVADWYLSRRMPLPEPPAPLQLRAPAPMALRCST